MRELDRRRRGASKDLEDRLCQDLEQRGLEAPVSRNVARRIAPGAAGLSGDAYGAFLDGVVAIRSESRSEPGAEEIQRLVNDFAIELKKLDEGLRLLSTYLLRIRERTRSQSGGRVIH